MSEKRKVNWCNLDAVHDLIDSHIASTGEEPQCVYLTEDDFAKVRDVFPPGWAHDVRVNGVKCVLCHGLKKSTTVSGDMK